MRDYKPYITFIIFILVVYLCFLIAKPFLSAVFTGIILAYLFYPIYRFFCSRIKRDRLLRIKKESICAVVVTIIVLALLLVPSVFIAKKMTTETISIYNFVKSRDFTLTISSFFSGDVSDYVKQIIDRALYYILKVGSDFILAIPKFVLNFFIAIFVMFFLLMDGARLISKANELLPLSTKTKEQILARFKKTTDALLYGNFVIAVIEGILMLIAFLLFGIQGAFLWSLIVVIFSFLPILGASFVWIPLAIVQLFQGDYFTAIGLAVYSIAVIGPIETFAKPKFVGKRADIHPVTILIGVLGGVSLMGMIGFIVGPLILALLLEFLKIYGGKNETKG